MDYAQGDYERAECERFEELKQDWRQRKECCGNKIDMYPRADASKDAAEDSCQQRNGQLDKHGFMQTDCK
jgi:hypothetical protein